MARLKRQLRSLCKERLLGIGAFVLFHSKVLSLVNLLVNNVQPKKNPEEKLLFPFVRKRGARNVQILIYHRVNDAGDRFFPATPTLVFARQMEFLRAHFSIYSLEEAVERMKRKDIPNNAVVITFDDGYKDNYLNAFPILKNFSIPATIFLSTGAIGTGKMLWHDHVFSAFRETREPFFIGYSDSINYLPLRTLKEKLLAQDEILRFLMSLEDTEKLRWVDRLKEKLRVTDRVHTPDLMLAWDEVIAMNQAGLFFGSHTITHPILSKLSIERAREEISGSKSIIEKNLNVQVKAFAYPNGGKSDFTEDTKRILKEVGYTCAVSTIFGSNEHDQDLFELRRARPWEDDLALFAMKLNWYKFIIGQ